ncbi:alanine--tRNA ligase [Psychrosphaera ytuae]|uniref:Alanine--tRNA ligase n=1 Tax=Psychrosphaera ytuae TaxID=2820710 RepID=A0A975DEZ9_9GAMM|nr:alanine--tRNA ligase [Psychrosphaera ytuae]QTH65201.1 alanine--tRNA ligase [Psychrosphaera ytuae]
MYNTTAALRTAFLEFFKSKEHQIVQSSSLVPGNDPTLLFTNAGMVPFKDVFLGAEQRPYTRATSSQRCVRAGGKHNDLENVGYTARHHTFFEMLGNFSFGDYFKQDAIKYAWEFLTKVLELPEEKLLVTVYETDDEAFDIWNKEIGVPAEKIIRIGDKSADKKYESDNFWSMGDTGPCGPCSEIFYDHGEHIWGGPPGSPEEDGDRFIEIWNIVFMQFNRSANGDMAPLPKPSVDTGMGIERIAAILQGVHSNYEIDIFQNLIKSTADLLKVEDLENKSLRVIADHIRSCSFLIVDGVMPSNEGRGYVLRRIIRRAVRHGHKLGAQGIFFNKLVATLVAQMGEAYPELAQKQAVVEKMLRIEEEQFAKTLERGLALLESSLADMQGDVIPGELVFSLYDTYGFPADLTADIAREKGLSIDEAGFEAQMLEQRKKSQAASSFKADYNDQITSQQQSEFRGYDATEFDGKVTELFADGQSVESLADGQQGILVLDNTPFYAESGGQSGDKGEITVSGGSFVVADTQKLGNAIAHYGTANGSVNLGDLAKATIDTARREAIKKNHSATHLIHAALRNVLGEHVGQKGSLVEADKFRFDFSHYEGVTAEQIKEVERQVNQQIQRNLPLGTEVMAIEDAKAKGAMALFGEKYDDEVRVVSMGDYSIELCGGTHVNSTGDIGLFKIISEAGIAAGVRRIEAVTGLAAVEYVHGLENTINQAASVLKAEPSALVEKVEQSVAKVKQLEKELRQLQDKMASQQGSNLTEQVKVVNGVNTLIVNLGAADPKSLRGLVDDLKNKIGSVVMLLVASNDNKVSLIAGVTKDLIGKVKSGDLVNAAAAEVGGKGGGRPDMAQAGGSQPENIDAALAAAEAFIASKLV